MNVSKQADAEFMLLLEIEDPKRYRKLIKAMRQDKPDSAMPESQALTNYMLGLPTGQYRFAVVRGKPAPSPLTAENESKFNQKPFRPATSDRGGRPRKFKTNADRQKAHRKAENGAIPQKPNFAFSNPDISATYEGVS
jgi:hypothetical protein